MPPVDRDKRLTPARPDLAAAHLKGKVEAARFAEGRKYSIQAGHAALRAAPDGASEQVSELLHGEDFTVYESKDGYAWGQATNDHYVGYVKETALGAVIQPDKRVTALMTPVFSGPGIKFPVSFFLPLGAVLQQQGEGDFITLPQGGFVHYRHLAPLEEHASDFVSVAERFAGVPYVWGGKTAAGLDCSGLVQTSLQAAGISAPRDTDMMEKALGLPVDRAEIQRGDLVFWKGHMGVMLDRARLLHANAFHVEVFAESLDQAVARIAQTATGPVTAIKRL
jgi:cell wall-associated NlpC family hydrolase